MTQIQNIRAAVKLLGLNSYLDDTGYSIDPEAREYKIKLVLDTSLHPQFDDNKLGLILSVPMREVSRRFGDVHSIH